MLLLSGPRSIFHILTLTQQPAPFFWKVAIPSWNNFLSALPSVKKLLVQPNELIYGIRLTQRECAMPYEYDQEPVLANGIYLVANATEMDARTPVAVRDSSFITFPS